jgi:cell wall-associated NlpC family hydrolase
MRRLLLPLALLLLVPSPADAAIDPAATWAKAEIRLVVARGLMAQDVTTFRPTDELKRAELGELVAALTATPVAAAARPADPVTIAALDARLVGALGLQDEAATFAAAARAAGLKPPGRFGTEVVARLLGLRKNHPAALDVLERQPNEPATRAEAAFSAARILRLTGWEADRVRKAAATFVLPELSAWQQRILRTAFSFVGYPYVWGGESETLERGFDCSGFVWRVYKLEPYGGVPQLAQTLKGRTTYAMSAEVKPAQRIGLDELEPGDVAFFGAKGPRSKPAQVDHMGIYVGSDWIIHSSSAGVTLVPLAGWFRERFAWARRPLVEAALES